MQLSLHMALSLLIQPMGSSQQPPRLQGKAPSPIPNTAFSGFQKREQASLRECMTWFLCNAYSHT